MSFYLRVSCIINLCTCVVCRIQQIYAVDLHRALSLNNRIFCDVLIHTKHGHYSGSSPYLLQVQLPDQTMCWKYTCSHLQSTLLNIHLPWEREPVRPVSMSCWCLPQVVVSSQYTFLNTNNYYNFLCDQFCLHLIQSKLYFFRFGFSVIVLCVFLH